MMPAIAPSFTGIGKWFLRIVLFGFTSSAVLAADEPLDFSFTQIVPGQKILIDGFSLHVHCIGDGNTTVLFEAGLGGSSIEWKPIQEKIGDHAKACIYDRAGYAWSDPAPFPRHARELAREADILLTEIGVDGPLVLVGHSFGGFVVRELSYRRPDTIRGMVLVDASHEDQLERLESVEGKSMMPRGNNFYVSPVEIPQSLPDELKRKIEAFSRMRKTYAALHAEMSQFRLSASQVKQDRQIVDYPLVVISRGLDLYSQDRKGQRKTAIWKELQNDLAMLSTNAELVIAEGSGHHVHTDDPALIVKAILSILDSIEESVKATEK